MMIVILAADLILLKKEVSSHSLDQQSLSFVNPLTRSIMQRMFSFDCLSNHISVKSHSRGYIEDRTGHNLREYLPPTLVLSTKAAVSHYNTGDCTT